MNRFCDNLAKKIGKDNFKKIQSVNIGLAGAGGLGSNCAINLVRVGFKKLTIVDFDKVDLSNLDRQFYFRDQVGMNKVTALGANLLRVNPELKLRLIKKKIKKENINEFFAGCDIVAECLDRPDYKSMLIEELLGLGKIVVAVSGLGGTGLSDEIKIHRINDKLTVIGDLKSDIKEKPALSPRVNIAAAKQADFILELIINAY